MDSQEPRRGCRGIELTTTDYFSEGNRGGEVGCSRVGSTFY